MGEEEGERERGYMMVHFHVQINGSTFTVTFKQITTHFSAYQRINSIFKVLTSFMDHNNVTFIFTVTFRNRLQSTIVSTSIQDH